MSAPLSVARLQSSAASANPTSVKATNANVYRVMGVNTNAAIRYLKLYDLASSPTVGTDTPKVTLALPAQAVFNYDLDGLWFPAGLGFGLVTGAADNDTTGVGSGDILGLNILYT